MVLAGRLAVSALYKFFTSFSKELHLWRNFAYKTHEYPPGLHLNQAVTLTTFE